MSTRRRPQVDENESSEAVCDAKATTMRDFMEKLSLDNEKKSGPEFSHEKKPVTKVDNLTELQKAFAKTYGDDPFFDKKEYKEIIDL